MLNGGDRESEDFCPINDDLLSAPAEYARGPGIVYTEGVGGSNPSSPTSAFGDLSNSSDAPDANGELLDTPNAPR
jgi:hypothetical protein